MISIGVVQFPGSNCERETAMAIRRSGMQPVDVMWTAGVDLLNMLDGFIIVGGFSFEDRVRSGAIAAQSPLMKLLTLQAKQGKPILGICNGAQVLVETGLVPGFVRQNGSPVVKISLADNLRINHGEVSGCGYFNDWCNIKANQDGVFSVAGGVVRIPFAHAQGRFVIDEDTYALMQQAGVSTWQYCNHQYEIDGNCPVNPNGSLDNLAAVSNVSGNVMAMMPHPERTTSGDLIFKAMRSYIEKGFNEYQTITVDSAIEEIEKINLSDNSLLVNLKITDNEAVSLQQALHHLGFSVKVKKWVLWQIDATQLSRKKIIDSYELFNPNKENICEKLPEQGRYFLVSNKRDIQGEYTQRILQQQYQIQDLNSLQHGIIWGIEGDYDQNILQVLANLISQNIYEVVS